MDEIEQNDSTDVGEKPYVPPASSQESIESRSKFVGLLCSDCDRFLTWYKDASDKALFWTFLGLVFVLLIANFYNANIFFNSKIGFVSDVFEMEGVQVDPYIMSQLPIDMTQTQNPFSISGLAAMVGIEITWLEYLFIFIGLFIGTIAAYLGMFVVVFIWSKITTLNAYTFFETFRHYIAALVFPALFTTISLIVNIGTYLLYGQVSAVNFLFFPLLGIATFVIFLGYSFQSHYVSGMYWKTVLFVGPMIIGVFLLGVILYQGVYILPEQYMELAFEYWGI